jgi:hypothetical protein
MHLDPATLSVFHPNLSCLFVVPNGGVCGFRLYLSLHHRRQVPPIPPHQLRLRGVPEKEPSLHSFCGIFVWLPSESIVSQSSDEGQSLWRDTKEPTDKKLPIEVRAGPVSVRGIGRPLRDAAQSEQGLVLAAPAGGRAGLEWPRERTLSPLGS